MRPRNGEAVGEDAPEGLDVPGEVGEGVVQLEGRNEVGVS